MGRALLAFALSTVVLAPSVSAQVPDGDRLYSARAAGHQGARASAENIDAAIVAYRRALRPGDLESRWKLMRALRFRAAFVETSVEGKKKTYDEARRTGTEAMEVLDALLSRKGVKSFKSGSEREIVTILRSVPHAGEVLYWDAASWGEWAIVFGRVQAVKQGVADRLKKESTVLMMIDPRLEDGGGARILGRLHTETPRIPFFTGWASIDAAVKYLRQSIAVAPANKLTRLFLAEALLKAGSSNGKEAAKLLREIISTPPDPEWLVEDTSTQIDAKALLRKIS